MKSCKYCKIANKTFKDSANAGKKMRKLLVDDAIKAKKTVKRVALKRRAYSKKVAKNLKKQ